MKILRQNMFKTNGLISMKLTGLMQWAIMSLDINFQSDLNFFLNFVISSFNGYSGLLWP